MNLEAWNEWRVGVFVGQALGFESTSAVGRLPRAELPAGRRLREGGLSNQLMSKLSKERKRMNWVS